MLSSIRVLIKERAKEQGKRFISLPGASEEQSVPGTIGGLGHSPYYEYIVRRKYVSLGDIVYSLLDLGLSIEDIMTYAEHSQRDSSNN